MTRQDLFLIQVPLTGALSAGAGTLRYPVPFFSELVDARVAVATAPTGADVLVDINKNGTTIFTDQTKRLKVTAGQNVSNVAKVTPGVVAGANVIDPVIPSSIPVASFVEGDYITIDVDQIGSTVAGSNAVVSLTLNKK